MKRNKETGLSVRIAPAAAETGGLTGLTAYGLLWGWLLILQAACGLLDAGGWLAAPLTGGLVCLLWVLFWKKRSWLTPISLGAALVLALIFRGPVSRGFDMVWSRTAAIWTRALGRLFLAPAAEGSAALFTALAAQVLAVLNCRLAERWPRLAAGLLIAAAAVLTVLLHENLWPVLALAALVLAMAEQERAATVLLRGGLVLLCALVLAAACRSVPAGWFETIQRTADETVHRLRYEGNIPQLPEGDFTAPAREITGGETALLVTMDQPQPLYLRGFVGDAFDGCRWTAITDETAADQSALLYWLHRDGFWPQSQLGLVQDGETGRVSVENRAACRKYLYLPYNMKTLSGSRALEPEKLQPGAVMADGLTGERTYGFTVLTGAADRLAQTVEALRSEPDAGAYRSQEGTYRSFILTQDLQLPDTGLESLTAALEACTKVYGGTANLTTDQAEACVALFLEKYLAEGELTLPLDDMAKGTAYQTATVTVLALRYFGIPARYAEGYRVTEAQAQSAAAGETLAVPASSATAWAEIYQDGVGWVPLAETPGFADLTDQIADGLSAMENGGLSEGDGDAVLPEGNELEPEQDETDQNDEPADRTPLTHLKQKSGLLWLLLLIPVLLVLAIWLRHHLLLKKRQASFAQEDHREALCCLFRDTAALLEALGLRRNGGSMLALAGAEKLPPELARSLEQTARDNNEALFSSHPITRDQRQTAADLRTAVLEYFKQQKKWYKRLILKWLKCLY